MDAFDLGEQLLDDERKEKDKKLDQTRLLIETALNNCSNDPGAPYEDNVIEALRVVYDNNPADYMRHRSKFKASSKDFSTTKIDKLMKDKSTDSGKQLNNLVALVQKNATLFYNQDGSGFASIKHEGHLEI